MDSKKLLKEFSKLQKSLWEVNLSQYGNLEPSIINAKSALSQLESLLRKDQAAEKRQLFGQKVVKGEDAAVGASKKTTFQSRLKPEKKPKKSRFDKEPSSAEVESCEVSEILQKISGLKPRTLPWAAKLLGIAVTSDAEQAKLALRNRAKIIHPDTSGHPQSVELFQALQFALDDFLRFEKVQ